MQANNSKHSPSTTTTSSHITSNYVSGRSSPRSDVPRISTSSTTLHDSSQQSDSLYNEPTSRRRRPARVITSTFHNDQQGHHRDSSTPAGKASNHLHPNLVDNHRRQLPSSTIDLSSRKFSINIWK